MLGTQVPRLLASRHLGSLSALRKTPMVPSLYDGCEDEMRQTCKTPRTVTPLLPSLSLSPTGFMISTLLGRCPTGHTRGWKFRRVIFPKLRICQVAKPDAERHLPGSRAHLPAPYPTAPTSAAFTEERTPFPTASVARLLATCTHDTCELEMATCQMPCARHRGAGY